MELKVFNEILIFINESSSVATHMSQVCVYSLKHIPGIILNTVNGLITQVVAKIRSDQFYL